MLQQNGSAAQTQLWQAQPPQPPPGQALLAVQPSAVRQRLQRLAQSASQAVLQQKGSAPHTQASHAHPPQPLVVTALQPLCGTLTVVHWPFVQVCVAWHAMQALPAVPHAPRLFPARQLCPLRQPVQQLPPAHFPPAQAVPSGAGASWQLPLQLACWQPPPPPQLWQLAPPCPQCATAFPG